MSHEIYITVISIVALIHVFICHICEERLLKAIHGVAATSWIFLWLTVTLNHLVNKVIQHLI